MAHGCGSEIYTGISGYVTQVTSGAFFYTPVDESRLGRVTRWELSIDKEAIVWNDQGASGWKWSLGTVDSARGRISYSLTFPVPSLTPAMALHSDNVSLTLFVAPSFRYFFNATYANMQVVVNIHTADITGVEFDFVSNGAVRALRVPL